MCRAGGSPLVHITPHVSPEQRHQGGAAMWLSEDAIDHLSWVRCTAPYKSQREPDLPSSLEWNHFSGLGQQLLVVVFSPPFFAALQGF